jgi:hypothetical protein
MHGPSIATSRVRQTAQTELELALNGHRAPARVVLGLLSETPAAQPLVAAGLIRLH